jgi:hypothetical protein
LSNVINRETSLADVTGIKLTDVTGIKLKDVTGIKLKSPKLEKFKNDIRIQFQSLNVQYNPTDCC